MLTLRSDILGGEVFVVDDDEDLCEIMTCSIKLEGLRVRSFGNGEGALIALSLTKPSVMVVDFFLGDMDGCEFLRRKDLISKECPVILVSGSPDEVKSLVPEGEYVSIIEKPLDLERLLQKIKAFSAPYSQKSLT